MRRRARWRNRSSGSFSGSALPTARGSSARLRAKLWNGLSIASGYTSGERRQPGDDDSRASFASARLAQLFRLLRNALCTDSAHPLGPAPTASRYVAAMENTTPSPSVSLRTGGSPATGQHTAGSRLGPLYVAGPEPLSVGRSTSCFARPAARLIRSPNAPTLYATRRLLSLAVRRDTEESCTEERYDEFLCGLANNPVNPKVLQPPKKA